MHAKPKAALRLGLVALSPLVALMIYDLMAYETVHLLSMIGFQSTANTPLSIMHKAVATLCALGGVAVLPIVGIARPKSFVVGGLVGAAVGLSAATTLGQSGTPLMATVLFSIAGGAALGGAAKIEDTTDALLWAWLGSGLIFLLTLRFSASRYLIPFFAPAILLSLKRASRPQIVIAVLATVGVGLGVSMDDLDLAEVQRDAALRAAATGKGRIGGHWGFQHHLLQAGWIDIEEDERLPKGVWVAMSAQAWPQQPANTCWDYMEIRPIKDPRPGIRVMSAAGGANLHGHMLAGSPPIPVFAPWTFASDPMDHLTMRRTCP
jgi:outer membrane lipoprotein SlyB